MTFFSRIFRLESPKAQNWWGALAAVLLLFALALPVFKDYFTRPNTMMYSFGGDALMLYYNTAYHTRYDNGPVLRSMNYPDGEYIYLTDAQGSLSNTLQWINRHIADISFQTVGFVNGLNLYLLFAGVLFLFFALRELKVSIFTAALFSPLILLLSPQIWRMGGHFGLAYPFLIPMAIWWFLRKYRVGKLEKRDALVLLTSLFFTYNNPYTGFDINVIWILTGLLLFVSEGFKLKNWKRPAIIAGMGLATLAIVFIDFKLNDPVHDRLNPQWGFFFFHARFEGMLYPQHSILADWLKKSGLEMPDMDFETMLNMGIVTALALTVMLFMTLYARLKRKNKPEIQRLSPESRIVLWATLLIFLIASNTNIIKVPHEWLEEHMGWLTMFKASGRLAWPFYFGLTLTAMVFIDRLYGAISLKNKYLGWGFALALASLWNAEFNQYTRPKFKEVFYQNHFDPAHEQEILDILRQNNVNPSDYQAMLCVPKMMAWSDKVLSDINYRTQHFGCRVSLATGLPMINSMLSRIGLQHTLERVQMLSNPLVERTLLQKLPNQKDILLLVGSDAIPELKDGSKFLVDISQRVAEAKDFSLYRLHPADLVNTAAMQTAKKAYQEGQRTAPTFYLSFDDTPNEHSFYGAGSHETKPKEDALTDFVSPFERDTQMMFSAWTYVDAGLRNPGFWMLKIKNQAGAEVDNIKLETRKSNNVQGNWMRVEAQFTLPRGGSIHIDTYGERTMLIDEVMAWPVGVSPIVDIPGAESFLYENYKIKK